MDASLLSEKLLFDATVDLHALQKERCFHFSIRGYVSGVRKRDLKICWPFHEFQNPNDRDKHENVLPPLPVAKFKWWDCKQCLRKNSNAIEGSVEIPNGFLGTGNRMIQSEQLGPNEEHKLSKPSSLKEVIKHTSRTTSVFDVLGNDYIRTMSISVDNEAVHCQQKSEGQTSKPVNSISMFPYPSTKEKSSEEFDVLVKENRPICKVASTEKNKTNAVDQYSKSQMKKRPYHGKLGYSLLNKCAQRVGGKKINRTHVFAPKGILSDESKDSASVTNYLIGSKPEVQHVNDHHDSSNKCWNKKSQKTRTMDDILKSDVLGMAKKTPACDRQLSSVKRKHGSEPKSYAYKDQKQNGTEDKEKSNKMIKNKKQQQISENEDDEFPLMHWINRIPDKAKPVKLDGGETKFFDHSNIPKSESVVPSGKQLDFMVKSFGSNEGNKKVISQGKRHCRLSDDESLQKDIMSHKRCTDWKFGKINTGITATNSSRDLLTDDKKGSTGKKQNMTSPHVDNREHPPVHCAKEFLQTSDNGKVPASTLETINEKPSEEKLNQSDPEVVDGVPVEILKLLQENWLKRQSVNTECSDHRLVHISEMNKEATKNGISLDLNQSNQDEVASSSVKIHEIDPKSRSCGAEHEIPGSFMKIHDRPSSESGNDLGNSHHEYDFGIGKFNASNGSTESSYFREERKSGVTLPLINSLENQSHHHPSHKIGISSANPYSFGSEGYDLFREYPHYKSYPVTSNLQSEMANSSDILLPAENFLGKPSQTVLLRKPRNLALERGESATNSIGHLQHRSKKNLLVGNVSGFDLYNTTRTMSPPSMDLYKNETYSAMHLLRLMDPAVSSSVPLCSSIDRRLQPDFTNFNLNRELGGTPNNLRPNQPFMHPAAATHENLGPSHHHNHQCNQHHPEINSNVSFEVQRHRTSSLMDNTWSANYRPFSSPQPDPLQKKKNAEVTMKSPNPNGSNTTELCVVNRNPADFISPDESNEYMIGFDEPKVPLTYPNPKKRKQKAMKLTALKGLLRN